MSERKDVGDLREKAPFQNLRLNFGTSFAHDGDDLEVDDREDRHRP